MDIITIKKESEIPYNTPPYPCWLIERRTGSVIYAYDSVSGFEISNNKFVRKKYTHMEYTFQRYDLFKGEINIKIT